MSSKQIPKCVFVPEKNLLRKIIRNVAKCKSKQQVSEIFNAKWSYDLKKKNTFSNVNL